MQSQEERKHGYVKGEVTNQEEREQKHEKSTTDEQQNEIPLMALNHVSRLCKNVKESEDFYTKVLGFVLIERPQAFDFNGAWLFNYGVGIHLVQAKEEDRLPNNTDTLDPMDNHISFQSEDMEGMVERLKQLNIKYLKRTVGEEEGAAIDQLFFKDPDGHMIEICNCENVKLVPQRSIGRIKLPFDRHIPPVELGKDDANAAKA
ncbi:glyoxylase I 4-like [Nicotiana tabacum]|uniref:Metallothiol transferase FosB-like n=1 Tax=Nicotiana tabacum TaxID=4097 RepID=A0A1S3X1A2_TOBAC|nr:PREDICTED: metallothiol transferase FosB-like [Nicotiana tabacum]XP_016487266.1 PREDICTED: metallothiol transferase FosB-like [Nicotiana tabacum]